MLKNLGRRLAIIYARILRGGSSDTDLSSIIYVLQDKEKGTRYLSLIMRILIFYRDRKSITSVQREAIQRIIDNGR